MLALAKVAPGRDGLALGEYEVREPGPHEVLIEVLVGGVCGTDMQIFHGHGAFADRLKLPTILGHEMCGRVQAVGSAVSRTQVGDLVSLESHLPCGECASCRSGRSHVCPATRYPGIDFHGCFAEYVTVPEAIVWVNPDHTDPERAVLLEPLGIAVHATLEGRGVAGRTVVINGCGPIGLMNVAVARHYGAAAIVAVDVNDHRLAIAEQMGADLVVNAEREDVVQTVRRYFDGDGAEVVIEYTGSAAGVRSTFQVVAPLGEVKWCATPAGPIEFDFGLWRSGRPIIYNIHGRRLWETWYACAPLVYEEKLDLAPIASHRVPLSEARDAFELILSGQAVKPLIVCG